MATKLLARKLRETLKRSTFFLLEGPKKVDNNGVQAFEEDAQRKNQGCRHIVME
jgi:hypothetical protein